MNFTSLEYFIITVQEGSITRAAERMYISQQAMSNHIRKLEEEVGLRLLERTVPVTLTYAGREFLKNARRIMAIEKQMMQQMSDIRSESKGTLLVGINHSRGASLLPRILPSFCQKHPDIEVKLIEGYSTSLEEALLKDEVDINIGFHPRFMEQVKNSVIRVVDDSVVMLVSHRLMEQLFGDRVEEVRRQMREKPDIGYFQDAPFVMLNHKMTIRKQVDDFMQKHGFAPKIALETASLETQLALALQDFGVCFHSRTMIESLNSAYKNEVWKRMEVFDFDDSTLKACLCAYFRKDSYLSRGAKEFIDELMMYYNKETINWSEIDVLQDQTAVFGLKNR